MSSSWATGRRSRKCQNSVQAAEWHTSREAIPVRTFAGSECLSSLVSHELNRFPHMYLTRFFFFPFPFTGNTWLRFLFERNSREDSDSYKLPSPSLALPPDWGAAHPTHVERGRTQPLRGPFCSGPYGRLIDDIPPKWKRIFLQHHPFFFSFFVKWPLCTRDHWDKY